MAGRCGAREILAASTLGMLVRVWEKCSFEGKRKLHIITFLFLTGSLGGMLNGLTFLLSRGISIEAGTGN